MNILKPNNKTCVQLLMFLTDTKHHDLADEVGVSRAKVSLQLSQCRKKPNYPLLERISEYFAENHNIDLTADELISDYSPDLFLIEGYNA